MPSAERTKAVVVVESPAKAKTIQKYLGPGYKVLASYGHVRDLPKKDGSVDPERDFAMVYEELPDRKKRLDAIAQALAKADALVLATDPDREGEAIAWHVVEAMRARGALAGKRVLRIAFHEITKRAIEEALAHPRAIDARLVHAQQARRALDYLVGFNLSPVLWRKIRTGLSAGRVQSAALRLICEREEEIRNFKPREYWTVEAELANEAGAFAARLVELGGKKLEKFSLADKEAAERARKAVQEAQLRVARVEKKRRKRQPPPPFITSTLQMEAARRLGFSATKTMRIAQRLYEGVNLGGEPVALITYMRTDSVALAEEAVAAMRALIAERFGAEYLPKAPRKFKTSTKNAQEAHEAIRPTDPARTPESVQAYLQPDEAKLYELIWRRALASQMAAAELDLTSVRIEGEALALRASGQVVVFDGFARLYEETREDKEGEEAGAQLPPLAEGEPLKVLAVQAKQHFTEPPARYTEASLIKALESLGIGRPSTYATILDVLRKRGYVRMQRRRFVPTDVGEVVNRFLTKHFPDIVDVGFTAEMEDKLDAIARGETEWKPVLRAFWGPFAEQVQHTLAKVSKREATTEELNEACPECGKPLVVRLGRYGRFIACSGFPSCRYTRPLEDDAAENEAQPEKAPSCPSCGAPMQKKQGRYGAFWSCSRYPECKTTRPLVEPEDTGVPCPRCGKGTFLRKRSRRGRVFYSCSRYPECEEALWDEPVARACPACGAPIVVKKRSKRRGEELVCIKEGCKWRAPISEAEEARKEAAIASSAEDSAM